MISWGEAAQSGPAMVSNTLDILQIMPLAIIYSPENQTMDVGELSFMLLFCDQRRAYSNFLASTATLRRACFALFGCV